MPTRRAFLTAAAGAIAAHPITPALALARPEALASIAEELDRFCDAVDLAMRQGVG